jgi:hypothetical protein
MNERETLISSDTLADPGRKSGWLGRSRLGTSAGRLRW